MYVFQPWFIASRSPRARQRKSNIRSKLIMYLSFHYRVLKFRFLFYLTLAKRAGLASPVSQVEDFCSLQVYGGQVVLELISLRISC